MTTKIKVSIMRVKVPISTSCCFSKRSSGSPDLIVMNFKVMTLKVEMTTFYLKIVTLKVKKIFKKSLSISKL